MNLQLFVKDKLIASHPIDNSSMSNPFYLSSIKKELEEQYKEIIEESKSTPTFCIESKSIMSSRRRKGYNFPVL
jgi:hypothetical protein